MVQAYKSAMRVHEILQRDDEVFSDRCSGKLQSEDEKWKTETQDRSGR